MSTAFSNQFCLLLTLCGYIFEGVLRQVSGQRTGIKLEVTKDSRKKDVS